MLDIKLSNVPDIRVTFRSELHNEELNFVKGRDRDNEEDSEFMEF